MRTRRQNPWLRNSSILMCRLFSFLMVVFLGLMVVMVFGNVVLRYGFNSGITVSEEAFALAVRVDDLPRRARGPAQPRTPGNATRWCRGFR